MPIPALIPVAVTVVRGAIMVARMIPAAARAIGGIGRVAVKAGKFAGKVVANVAKKGVSTAAKVLSRSSKTVKKPAKGKKPKQPLSPNTDDKDRKSQPDAPDNTACSGEGTGSGNNAATAAAAAAPIIGDEPEGPNTAKQRLADIRGKKSQVIMSMLQRVVTGREDDGTGTKKFVGRLTLSPFLDELKKLRESENEAKAALENEQAAGKADKVAWRARVGNFMKLVASMATTKEGRAEVKKFAEDKNKMGLLLLAGGLLVKMVPWVMEKLSDMLTAVVKYLSETWDSISNYFSNMGENIANGFGEMMTGVREWWDSFTVSDIVTGVWNAIGGFLGKIISPILAPFKAIGGLISKSMQGVDGFISKSMQDVGGLISKSVQGVGEFLKNPIEKVGNWASSLFGRNSNEEDDENQTQTARGEGANLEPGATEESQTAVEEELSDTQEEQLEPKPAPAPQYTDIGEFLKNPIEKVGNWASSLFGRNSNEEDDENQTQIPAPMPEPALAPQYTDIGEELVPATAPPSSTNSKVTTTLEFGEVTKRDEVPIAPPAPTFVPTPPVASPSISEALVPAIQSSPYIIPTQTQQTTAPPPPPPAVSANQGTASAGVNEAIGGGVVVDADKVISERLGGQIRNRPVTPALKRNVAEAVVAVYGKGSRATLYSGGQGALGSGENRYGSTRHDLGRAGDFYIYGPDGKQIKGDELGKLAQYWLAANKGGVGLEMRGGGIHLDEHLDRGRYWNYLKDGGSYTRGQQIAVAAGVKGQMPELKTEVAGVETKIGNTSNPVPPPGDSSTSSALSGGPGTAGVADGDGEMEERMGMNLSIPPAFLKSLGLSDDSISTINTAISDMSNSTAKFFSGGASDINLGLEERFGNWRSADANYLKSVGIEPAPTPTVAHPRPLSNLSPAPVKRTSELQNVPTPAPTSLEPTSAESMNKIANVLEEETSNAEMLNRLSIDIASTPKPINSRESTSKDYGDSGFNSFSAPMVTRCTDSSIRRVADAFMAYGMP